MTWALVRYWETTRDSVFRHRFGTGRVLRLVSATGASAGNINSVLATLEWCDTRAPRRPEESLLWRGWIDTGFEELLDDHARDWTERRGRANSPADSAVIDKALLGRRSFDGPLLAAFKAVMDSAVANAAECNVPIGITLTRVEPEEVVISGNVRAANQRFASVIVARPTTARGGVTFHQPDAGIRDDRGLGTIIAMADTTGSAIVSPGSVFGLIKASSAFPVAFAPVELAYYPADRLDTAGSCPRAAVSRWCLSPARHLFMDGGVFDNTPLGFARRLAFRRARRPSDTAGFGLAYVDAGSLRGTLSEYRRRERPAIPSEGVATLLAFGRGVVPSARQYELQMLRRVVLAENEGRTRSIDDTVPAADYARIERTRQDDADTTLGRVIRPTTRGRPIMGERLLAFGAFLAQPLRQHDFYVGVYDGLRFAAGEYRCASPDSSGARAHSRGVPPLLSSGTPRDICVWETVRDLIGDADPMTLGPVARYAVRHALARESGDEYLPRIERPRIEIPRNGSPADSLDQAILAKLLALNDTLIRRSAAATNCPGTHPVEAIACREHLTYMFGQMDDDSTLHKAVKARRDSLCGGRAGQWKVLVWIDDKERNIEAASCRRWKNFERLIESPRVHLDRRLQLILRQLWRVEDYRADQKLDNWETGLELAEFAYLTTAERFRRGFAGDPSTIPPYEGWKGLGALSLLPYQATFGLSEQGYLVGWRPTLYVKHNFLPFISVELARLHRRLPNDDAVRWHVWPGLGAQHRITGSTFVHKLVTGFGVLNPWQVTVHSSASVADGQARLRGALDAERLGGEIAAFTARGKLKVGVRRVPETLRRNGTRTAATALTAGVSDLNGMLYWALRVLR